MPSPAPQVTREPLAWGQAGKAALDAHIYLYTRGYAGSWWISPGLASFSSPRETKRSTGHDTRTLETH